MGGVGICLEFFKQSMAWTWKAAQQMCNFPQLATEQFYQGVQVPKLNEAFKPEVWGFHYLLNDFVQVS